MSSVIVMRAWPSAADLGWVEPEVDDQVAGEGVPGRGSEAAASRCRSARRAGRCARARVVENLPPPLRRGGLLSRAGSRVARPFAPVHALVTPRAASPRSSLLLGCRLSRRGRLWDAYRMPWVPELFSAPVVQRLQEKWQREQLEAIPYFDGLMAGEHDALVESFAGEPELHDPVRGRVKGLRAFEAFVIGTNAWLAQRGASVEDVEHVITEPRGFEEVVLHVDGETGRVDLPVAIVADHHSDGRI